MDHLDAWTAKWRRTQRARIATHTPTHTTPKSHAKSPRPLRPRRDRSSHHRSWIISIMLGRPNGGEHGVLEYQHTRTRTRHPSALAEIFIDRGSSRLCLDGRTEANGPGRRQGTAAQEPSPRSSSIMDHLDAWTAERRRTAKGGVRHSGYCRRGGRLCLNGGGAATPH